MTSNRIPDCQDWKPVVINNRTLNQKLNNKPNVDAPGRSSLENVGVYKAASDEDTKKTKYVTKPTSDAVRTARCEKKLTQKELAQKCNMDAAIISEIERGGCVYNPAHINKLQSVLETKIPRS